MGGRQNRRERQNIKIKEREREIEARSGGQKVHKNNEKCHPVRVSPSNLGLVNDNGYWPHACQSIIVTVETPEPSYDCAELHSKTLFPL